jgi:uncharacterized protein (UPF0248 family)
MKKFVILVSDRGTTKYIKEFVIIVSDRGTKKSMKKFVILEILLWILLFLYLTQELQTFS